MSNDPSLSSASENSPRRGADNGGRTLGDGSGGGSSSSHIPLTPQKLREQRLAHLMGNTSQSQQFQEKSSPSITPKSSPSTKSIDDNTSTPENKKSVGKNNITSSLEKNITNGNTHLKQDLKEKATNTNTAAENTVVAATVTADLDDENLQAALALSLGLPPSKFDNLHPLPVFEGKCDETIDDHITTPDNLQIAAVAAATAMEIEDQDNDIIMSNNDRKPPAIDTTTVPTSPTSRILRNDPRHFSGRVRTWYKSAAPCNVLDFHHCMWDTVVTTENDQKRWLAQGIQFKEEHDHNIATRTKTGTTAINAAIDTSSLLATIISGPGVWCLTQQHGGPCGVLASIQAELLRILLFGPRTVHPLSMISIDFPTHLTNEFTKAPPDMSRSKMRQVLALSMGIILARCSLMSAATLQDDSITDNERNDKENQTVYLPEPIVRLVLPKHELWDTTTRLEWSHLEPWDSHDGGGGLSNNLLTYTISMNRNIPTSETALKRQKRSCNDGEVSDNDNDFDHLCTELAHATAQFLLETNSLNWFQRPGGVLLMVMSIAFSRGIPKTQGDMDDLTAKLTSNFGHCSQELLNLLLTGQAVSNVFDHTLRPSGELICRGLQFRPAIGYLTQLEAMRYLEVGGFYKTPRFPIWVIGSTSHFTVMFGDAAALKESASDILLERVRRAFKRMDGGAEENGFIQTSQLEDFLQSLGLTNISEQGLQTLTALIEVNGAGIILWEDLWKRTSRLLTGASLESILDVDEETNNNNGNTASSTNPNKAVSDIPASEAGTNVVQLTDEELARKLQAEWNGEVVDLMETSAITTPTTFPTTTLEKFGPTFQLYHYNGLRGGNFRAFRVTRLSADEAIGASISLGVSNQSSHNTGGFGGELDAVLRTKWPSCKINWIDNSPPSIN